MWRIRINCAGVMYEAGNGHDVASELGSNASVLRSAERNVTDTIAINMIGTWSVTRALAPYLARGARIVNVSSSMASLGEMGPGYYGYRASKAGINVFTRTLAYEMCPRGILVNSVCPGWGQDEHGRTGRHARCRRGCGRNRLGGDFAARRPDRRVLPRRPRHTLVIGSMP
jgi:NAD(P)-dependent dehydrogenase (short-subunit alcohol dehydrogenase family)